MHASDETAWPVIPASMRPLRAQDSPMTTASDSSDGVVSVPHAEALPLLRQIVRGIGAPKGPNEKALEAKRARRSEIERLSRQRRNDQFAEMRAEVARLEKLEASLLLTKEAAAASAQQQRVAEGRMEEEQFAVVRRRREAMQSQYLYAVNEVRRLRDEQSRLQNMVHEKTLLHVSLQEIAENFVEEDMVTWDDAIAAWFDPLTMEDALVVMKESCERMATLDLTGGAWESSGGQFMGWRDKRKLNEATSTMYHGFTKVFPGRNALRLMETTWDHFCQEWFLQKTIVSAATELHIQVLQVLNDDVRIIRRRTQYKSMQTRSFHTVYMQFRIQTEDGFVVCMRTIQAPEIQRSLGENESWVDIFHWISFQHVRHEDGSISGCEVSFSGSITGGVMTFALHWLVESVLAVLRWEFVCVAPLFIMEQSEELIR